MSEIMPKLDKMSKIFEKYSETYDFKFCDLDEIDDVVDFIDTYWKKGHILVKSRELMDWQHLDKKNNRYNFVIARHKVSCEIHGLLGFIPISLFDEKLDEKLVWSAIWKVRDDVKVFGLGILLYYYLMKSLSAIEVLCISGISQDAKNNYMSLDFNIGVFEHYAFFNPIKNNFELAYFNKANFLNLEMKNLLNWKLEKISKEQFLALEENECFFAETITFKSKKYYLNRYLRHPVYNYELLGIYESNSLKALLVIREISVLSSKCSRIVDYIGKLDYLSNVKGDVSDFIVKNDYEYMDFMIGNADSSFLKSAGFISRKDNSDIIIPNYFEPFLKKNIEVGFAYISRNNLDNYILYKGDGDQDRPSVID